MRGLAGLVVTIALALLPSNGFAQGSGRRFSVSGGVGWTGGSNLGHVDANETTSGSGSYTLFASDSELGGATSVETALGARLSRLLQAELNVSYGQLDLRTHLSSDVEGIPDADASESIGQLTLEGSVLFDLVGLRLRQTMPFLTAGGGYLRHLHEGRMFVETGTIFHAGGGLLMPLGSAAAADARSALRFDVKAMIRNGGAIPDDGPHVSPSLSASFVWKF